MLQVMTPPWSLTYFLTVLSVPTPQLVTIVSLGANTLNNIQVTTYVLCAAFIRDARSNPSANHHLDKDICLICTL